MSAEIDRTDVPSSVVLKYLTVPNAVKVLAGYFFIYMVLSWLVPRVHGNFETGGQFGDMFGVVNAFASSVAMAGVMIAVWLQRDQVLIQGKELKEAMQQAKEQTEALKVQLQNAIAQSAIARQQYELASKDYRERNKPAVYTNRREDPGGANVHYVAHNAGGGHAVNVFYFDVNLTRAVAIGSLAAGEERVLLQAVNEPFKTAAQDDDTS